MELVFAVLLVGLGDEITDQRPDELVESEGRQPSLGGDQADREPLDHPDRDLRLLDAHALERRPVELEQLRSTDRKRTRGAWLPEHDAHLAEELTGPEPSDDALARPALAADLHLPRLDDVEVAALVAFVEDDVAVREASLEGAAHLDLCRFTGVQNEAPRPAPPDGRGLRAISSRPAGDLRRRAEQAVSPCPGPRPGSFRAGPRSLPGSRRRCGGPGCGLPDR